MKVEIEIPGKSQGKSWRSVRNKLLGCGWQNSMMSLRGAQPMVTHDFSQLLKY